MGDILRHILDDPVSSVTAAAGVVVVVVVLLVVWVVNRIRALRYAIPLQIKPLTRSGEAQTSTQTDIDLQTAIIAFIAADPVRRLAPGSMQRVEPRTLAKASFSVWVTVLLLGWSIATRRPALVVSLDRLSMPDKKGRWSVVVRISRHPSGRVVVAHSFTGTTSQLAEEIGAFCLNRVRRQSFVRRRTPPWERWYTDNGYLAYRKGAACRAEGLELRAIWKAQERQIRRREEEARQGGAQDELAALRQADLVSLRHRCEDNQQRSAKLLGRALQHFSTASRHDRSNVVPRLAAASLRELMDEYWAAIGLYAACRDQWPALVEPRYRLVATVDKRNPDALTCQSRADDALRELQRALSLRTLFRIRLRGRGQRRYVRELTRQRRRGGLPFRMSKRRQLLNGAEAARLTVLMWSLTQRTPADGRGYQSDDAARAEVRNLFEAQARLHGVEPPAALTELLHPDGKSRWRRPGQDPQVHADHEHQTMIKRLTYVSDTRHRPHIGWLAHYNAACFFAFASLLPADLAPWESSADCWVEDCVAAACRQIRHVYGDPNSELDPNWTDDDPDLVPVWEALAGGKLPRELSESMRWVLG
jgi:hypothetical protein